jgi:heavy metal sensor kinase
MSLRVRLTLLYTALLGGVLMAVGAFIYAGVSLVLLYQMDTTLAQAANNLLPNLRVSTLNTLDQRMLSAFQPTANVFYQIWDDDRQIRLAIPAGTRAPLDPKYQRTASIVYSDSTIGNDRIRVLSVPIASTRGTVGVVQVGINLNLLTVVQQSLATVLISLTVLAMVITAIVTSLLTRRVLAPLATMTRVADQITRADDLSRRIPELGARDDEVGHLIISFNQTLERLETLFTSQQRFVADVSHELRTPLTVIKGNIDLMQRMGEVDQEMMTSIEEEVDRLSRMVGDLLLLAKAESGKLPLLHEPIALDEVLTEVVAQMHSIADDRINLRLTEIDQLTVMGDRDQIKQVMVNLVDNALKYTPSGGTVTVALRRNADQAQFYITDTGPGIPEEDLPFIFDRFYRSEKSRTRSKEGGFGLGLSIAHFLVRAQGGTITVNSTEGKGTTFIVSLPLADASSLTLPDIDEE